MGRFSFLAIALGLQPVASQLCGVQADCSSCLSQIGCVWNMNVCLSSSTIPLCTSTPNCISDIGQCSVIVAPPASSPLYIPPVTRLPSVTGTVLPPVIGTSVTGNVLYPPAVSSLPLYPAALPTAVVGTVLPPVVSVLPAAPVTTVLSAPITETVVPAAPITTVSASAPLYASASAPLYSASAPLYASASVANVPPVYSSGAVGGGGGFYGNGGNVGYPLLRNDVLANAIAPSFPGFGAGVALADNVDVVSNAPDFVNNIVNDNGYRRNPVGNYARNGIYANALGGIIPGLSGPLNQFNKLDLFSSLLG